MPRKVDPLAPYRISTHKLGNYIYASTQPASVDEQTGKRTYSYAHWGRFDPITKKFTPNLAFMVLPPEERKKFFFPTDWDLSELNNISGLRKPGRPAHTRQGDRLYGDIWLLEKIAEKIGLKEDLLAVFGGNTEIVDAILTLAIFPYITKYSYNRLPHWQKIVRAPYEDSLTESKITKLTQSITSLHRDHFFKLRSARLSKDNLCAVDSTSRNAFGKALADIRWGKNKDHKDLRQTNEVVVYSLTDHLPIYYKTLPGNITDCRTFPYIVNELDRAGYKSITLITDRGYETVKNLELTIQKGLPMITAASVSRSLVMKHLKAYATFGTHPQSMTLDREFKFYFEQFKEKYVIKTAKETDKEAKDLNINLYFDSERRARFCKEQEIEIEEQRDLLEMLKSEGSIIEDLKEFKKSTSYFNVNIEAGYVIDFELNKKKVEKEQLFYGFFCLISHKLTDDAPTILRKYRLRDEQEKYFEHMKSQMGFRNQDNWSEDGKTGRLFIMFIGLMLASYVRYIWSTSLLKQRFDSSLGVLDEMRCIRLLEESGKEPVIAPFVGAQLEICEAFGIDVPPNSRPGYVSKRVRQVGRPRKTPISEPDS